MERGKNMIDRTGAGKRGAAAEEARTDGPQTVAQASRASRLNGYLLAGRETRNGGDPCRT